MLVSFSLYKSAVVLVSKSLIHRFEFYLIIQSIRRVKRKCYIVVVLLIELSHLIILEFVFIKCVTVVVMWFVIFRLPNDVVCVRQFIQCIRMKAQSLIALMFLGHLLQISHTSSTYHLWFWKYSRLLAIFTLANRECNVFFGQGAVLSCIFLYDF